MFPYKLALWLVVWCVQVLLFYCVSLLNSFSGDNGYPQCGLCRGCRWKPIKVLFTDGSWTLTRPPTIPSFLSQWSSPSLCWHSWSWPSCCTGICATTKAPTGQRGSWLRERTPTRTTPTGIRAQRKSISSELSWAGFEGRATELGRDFSHPSLRRVAKMEEKVFIRADA